jgi:hypothetical protein
MTKGPEAILQGKESCYVQLARLPKEESVGRLIDHWEQALVGESSWLKSNSPNWSPITNWPFSIRDDDGRCFAWLGTSFKSTSLKSTKPYQQVRKIRETQSKIRCLKATKRHISGQKTGVGGQRPWTGDVKAATLEVKTTQYDMMSATYKVEIGPQQGELEAESAVCAGVECCARIATHQRRKFTILR